ncbi:MAG: hypothetical protein ACLRWO_13130 [Clostridium butyricum]|uniref:hypothetical protein n=1 Tax=Clostridium TaxID=1485 RepID=UPI0028FF71D9|nr:MULTISPECIES: hypothetical protein [Clostridium]MDU1229903.1 hypothetical protein [Clostridium sp.]
MMELKKQDITELILHISELITEINLNTNHDAFMTHYGHTKQIEVSIYINGWGEKKSADFIISSYYDYSDYKENLEKIIEKLKSVK